MVVNKDYRIIEINQNSDDSTIILNITQDNSVFPICIYSKSTEYGLLDMEYFENLVRLLEIETQRSFLSKHEFKLRL